MIRHKNKPIFNYLFVKSYKLLQMSPIYYI
uniref:Uncharacterized protein n=1 Tax=Lepeophtheirus salmonis TaxID=72036 RepID=A0A0K2SX62_LEPSM